MGYTVKNISEQNRRVQSETGHMIYLGPGASTVVGREPNVDTRFFEVKEQKSSAKETAQSNKTTQEDDE